MCSDQPDTQAHCVQRPIIRENIIIKGDYSEIFSDDISKEISQTLLEITNFREHQSLSPAGGPSASDDAASRSITNVQLLDLG